MKIKNSVNEYGTPISIHICETCGQEFTVCPLLPDDAKGWENCMAETCASYDPKRDADKLFNEQPEKIVRTKIEKH